MRTFPKEDEENYIGKIVQQLCDLLDSGQGNFLKYFLEIEFKRKIIEI